MRWSHFCSGASDTALLYDGPEPAPPGLGRDHGLTRKAATKGNYRTDSLRVVVLAKAGSESTNMR
jgi:hypothetical protein